MDSMRRAAHVIVIVDESLGKIGINSDGISNNKPSSIILL